MALISPAGRRARDHRRVAVHRRLHALRRDLPARLAGHQRRDSGKAYMHVDECWYCGPCAARCPTGRRHRQHALSAPMKDRCPHAQAPWPPLLAAAAPRPAAPSQAPRRGAGNDRRRRRLPVQDHQHRHRRHPAALARLPREAARRPDNGTLQGRVAGLRHRRPHHRQMVAGKIDIGSMGDYPLLINASRTQAMPGGPYRAGLRHRLQPARRPQHGRRPARLRRRPTLERPEGQEGLRQRRLRRPRHAGPGAGAGGHRPGHGRRDRSTSSRRSAPPQLRIRQRRRRSRSSWPGRACWSSRTRARLLYDGAELDVPTFHGVVAREAYAKEHPEVLDAFLKAQIDATDYLHEHPLEAAESVAEGHRPAARGRLPLQRARRHLHLRLDAQAAAHGRARARRAVPEVGSAPTSPRGRRRPSSTTPTSARRTAPAYDADVARLTNPAAITGTDPVCGEPVDDPKTAGELWLDRRGPRPSPPPPPPACCARSAPRRGGTVRAAYVPDATTGTTWFADKSVWVRDPEAAANARFLPFTTPDGARRLPRTEHPKAEPVTYEARASRPPSRAADTGSGARRVASGRWSRRPRCWRRPRRLWQLLTVTDVAPVAALRPAADGRRDRRRVRAPARHLGLLPGPRCRA